MPECRAVRNRQPTGENLEPKVGGDHAAKTRVGLNLTWILITGFLVMFVQAGFALVETGLTRAQNAAHTTAVNSGTISMEPSRRPGRVAGERKGLLRLAKRRSGVA